MEETSNYCDRMFLLSLLPGMKKLSQLDNLDFRVKVPEALRRKLRRNAALEVEQTTCPSTSSSPALSQYSGNSFVGCTSASEVGPSMCNTLHEIDNIISKMSARCIILLLHLFFKT